MTNKPKLTPLQVDSFVNLPIREIEAQAAKFRTDDSSAAQSSYRAARQALSKRQRSVKARVMEFESTNTHHLLCYDSTSGFVKIAGTSVVFFTIIIAPRLHWRFSTKVDTDHYSISEDGIISLRSFDSLIPQLASIDILPDPDLDVPDLHFFKLPKVYSENQIATLRDRIARESERITTMLVPNSPMPLLYETINQVARLIYYRFKHLPDTYARETIAPPIIQNSHRLVLEYLAYANSPQSEAASHLYQISQTAQTLRHSMAYLSTLNVLHYRDIYKILDQLTTVERLANQSYKRLARTKSAHAR